MSEFKSTAVGLYNVFALLSSHQNQEVRHNSDTKQATSRDCRGCGGTELLMGENQAGLHD